MPDAHDTPPHPQSSAPVVEATGDLQPDASATQDGAEQSADQGAEHGNVPILMLLPNMVTLMGMCLGLTAIRFAIEGRFGMAVLLILLAVLADGLDGLLARRLGAESPLGAQLDSLSDFLCFGIAPAIVIYLLHLTQAGGYTWVFALLFAVTTCLRLARFNVMSGKAEVTSGPKPDFVGVPAPAGALLGLLPAFMVFSGVLEPGDAPVLTSIWLAIVGGLMVSKLRTPSPKAVRVPRRLIAVILFGTVIAIGMSFYRPWFILVAVDAAYIGILAHAAWRARKRRRR